MDIRGRRPRPARGWRAVVVVTLLLAPACAAAFEIDTRAGRWKLNGYAEGYFVVPTDADSQRQRPEGILDFTVAGDLWRTVRPVLDVQFLAGGPPENATGFGVFNFHDAFQNISPSIDFEEGYVDVALRWADVRLGVQKFAWGRLDTVHPADIVNPRQWLDPFITDETDAKIGIPAASITAPVPAIDPWFTDGYLTAIWVPIPIPFRFPLPGERWFPPAASVPATVSIPPGYLGQGLPGANITADFSAQNAPAGQRLSAGAVGLRWTALTAGVDWSLYFYNGRETAPALDLSTTIRLAADQPGGPIALDGDAVVRPRYGGIWLTGADAAFEFLGITARAEAVYGSNRFVPRSTADLLSLSNMRRAIGPDAPEILARLIAGETVPIDLGELFLRRDVVEWGLGADYPWHGWVPVLQVNQTVVLDNDQSLLLPNVDTRLLGALRKSWFTERLATEIIAIQSFERSSTVAVARATYSLTDALRIRLGYLAIGGSQNTLVGQYKANDELFVQIRYQQ